MGWMILLWIVTLVIQWGLGALVYHLFTKQVTPRTYPVTYDKKSRILGSVVAVVMVVILVIAIILSKQVAGTESFKRTMKNLQSDSSEVVERQVTVYLENGDIIFEREGAFDVEHKDERLKLIDEDGKVQIIYLGRTSTAIVEEE